ncbi:MAG TPA: hypothetical protein PK614_09155 [Nitrospira sp.]|nr:hypothetical protein [Nitrospira sp.]
MQNFRLTFKGASEGAWHALRLLLALLIDLPLLSFGSGYRRGESKPQRWVESTHGTSTHSSSVADWSIVGNRAVAYWKGLWHILGWFVGTIFPGSLLYTLLMTAWILLWAAAILALPIWIGMVVWQALH